MNVRIACLSLLAAALIAGCGPKQDQSTEQNAPGPDTSANVATNPSETQPLPAGTPEEPPAESKPAAKPPGKSPGHSGGGKQPTPKPGSVQTVEVTIPSGKSGGATLETALSSETSKVGDTFTATLAEDWTAEGAVAIPAGTKVMGHLSAVKPRARGKAKAMLTLSYDKLTLPDGKTLDISAQPQEFRAGGDTQGDAAKIAGGTVGGAIVGGATGNTKRGAIIGGLAGVGASLFSKGNPMDLEVGHKITVTLTGDAKVTVRKVVS